jgi:hypothetical protein
MFPTSRCWVISSTTSTHRGGSTWRPHWPMPWFPMGILVWGEVLFGKSYLMYIVWLTQYRAGNSKNYCTVEVLALQYVRQGRLRQVCTISTVHVRNIRSRDVPAGKPTGTEGMPPQVPPIVSRSWKVTCHSRLRCHCGGGARTGGDCADSVPPGVQAGFNRSVETLSVLSPVCRRKKWVNRSNTRQGPL